MEWDGIGNLCYEIQHRSAKNVSTTMLFQCFIFERGNQKVSKGCLAILLGIAIFVGVVLILAGVSVITWLDMLYYFSYVKLGITIIKWVSKDDRLSPSS